MILPALLRARLLSQLGGTQEEPPNMMARGPATSPSEAPSLPDTGYRAPPSIPLPETGYRPPTSDAMPEGQGRQALAMQLRPIIERNLGRPIAEAQSPPPAPPAGPSTPYIGQGPQLADAGPADPLKAFPLKPPLDASAAVTLAQHRGKSVSGMAPQFRKPEPGSEPWEVKAATEQMEKDRRFAEGMKDVAEGLGNMNLVTPGDILLRGNAPRSPRKAEGQRQAIEEIDSRVRPEESQALKAAGFNVPAGVRWKVMEEALRRNPNAMSAYQAANIAMQQARLEESELRRLQGADRLAMQQEGEARRQQAHLRPPQRILKDAEALLASRASIKTLREKWPEVKAKLGPLWGRLQALGRPIGMNDPEAAAFMAELRQLLGNYLTAQTGAQRGMVEVRFLESALPLATDSDATFEAVLMNFEDRVNRDIAVRRRMGERLNYDVSFYDDPEAALIEIGSGEDSAPATFEEGPAVEGGADPLGIR